MSELTQKEKADKVTVEYILAQLYDVTQSNEPLSVKLKVLTKLGDYLKMFEQNKRIELDIRSVVSQIGDKELEKLSGVKMKELGMFNTAGEKI